MPSAVNSASGGSTTIAALPASIPPHFQEAQHTLHNHRKNIVSLHRIHLKAANVTEKTPKGTRLIGEKAFNEVFFGCLDRVLQIKKGVQNADRICKFVAAYAVYAQEQFRLQARAAKASRQPMEEDDEDEEEEDTPATRFTTLLLKHLLKGFLAKDKNVRLRCCGSIALLINGLESLDENLFQTLKSLLLMRAKDKESSVRVQAVIALAKLQASEEDGEEDADDDVKSVLLDVLRFDPSGEVRRAALFNLAVTNEIKPLIIERLRDVDPINRRCVYLGSLSMLLQARAKEIQAGNASGPSRLGLDVQATEEVLRTGMGEREPSVKRAAKKLVVAWFDACGGDLVVFLNHFDVIHSEHAEAALHSIFEARPAIASQISFDSEDFWSTLSPTTAFLARAVVDHFKHIGNEARLEECLPMVTALAFRIQKEYDEMVALMDAQEDPALIEAKSFVVSQLLGIAMSSDYGDEIGRRKMFGLVRDMISLPSLPEMLIPGCLDVLLKLSNGQRDFMRMIVEIVQVLGGDDEEEAEEDESVTMDMDDSTINETRRGKKARRSRGGSAEPDADETQLNVRRLLIVRSMLERVVGALQENTAVHGLVPQLIAPAVKTKDPTVREEGLACLALCCMLDRKLALDTFPLFFDQVQNGVEGIKLCSVKAIFDLLVVHTVSYLCSRTPGEEETAQKQVITYLLSLLEDEDAAVQSAACEGMAKLMMAGMVDDDEALKSLVLVYMSPETIDNQQLRQCLSYFLPVYCLSSPSNQRRLQRAFIWIFRVLYEVYEERESSQEMATPLQVGLQLIDWTDPTKLVSSTAAADESVHLDVGADMLKTLFKLDDKDERKVLCQLLSKLYLPEGAEEWRVQELLLLVERMRDVNPLEDTVSRNALARFEASLIKSYPDVTVKGIKVADTPDLDRLASFFESCGIDAAAPARKQKVAAAPKARKPSSRRKHETSEEEEDEEGEEEDEDEDDE